MGASPVAVTVVLVELTSYTCAMLPDAVDHVGVPL